MREGSEAHDTEALGMTKKAHGGEDSGVAPRSTDGEISLSEEDIIKLAEFVGGPVWEAYIDPGKHPERVDLPDPSTDANADHAILERMRNGGAARYSDFKDKLFSLMTTTKIRGCQPWNYRVGLNALAALKVLP